MSRLQRTKILMTIAGVMLAAMGLLSAACSGGGTSNESASDAGKTAEIKGQDEHGAEHGSGEAGEVKLSEEALKEAKIETAEAVEQAADEVLRVTGSVETNQQQTQQVTPLAGGRVERVNVALGDRVRAGAALAVISSPAVAEMHGKLHEAETRLMLATQTLERIRKPENRVSVTQARAKLDEAEANLRRTNKLIEIGAGAGKDQIAAEAAYKTAKAEYEFQSNISLNREVQQAQAEVETARVEVDHLRSSLRSLGASLPETGPEHGFGGRGHDTSIITLRAPISGTITERLVNAGAGIEAGKPLFTIADISNLWVIANVPEAQVKPLRTGTTAQVRSAGGGEAITGRVTYIDPILNEETRTARVRVEIANPGERLKVGNFVEISFRTAGGGQGSAEKVVVIPDEAVQRLGERSVVFVPDEKEPGHFDVREVQAGGLIDGRRQITGGLKAGEKVVSKGGFTLKTQLLKGEMGEHGH
ncbi:MAG TPA: efflux RND transporter periplasmic adaptor subunit [Blastocatellia bacterium]|nr:efflux RND transporter periplasmic adaptor subunit [Blastocatellia bacterium]